MRKQLLRQAALTKFLACALAILNSGCASRAEPLTALASGLTASQELEPHSEPNRQIEQTARAAAEPVPTLRVSPETSPLTLDVIPSTGAIDSTPYSGVRFFGGGSFVYGRVTGSVQT